MPTILSEVPGLVPVKPSLAQTNLSLGPAGLLPVYANPLFVYNNIFMYASLRFVHASISLLRQTSSLSTFILFPVDGSPTFVSARPVSVKVCPTLGCQPPSQHTVIHTGIDHLPAARCVNIGWNCELVAAGHPTSVVQTIFEFNASVPQEVSDYRRRRSVS